MCQAVVINKRRYPTQGQLRNRLGLKELPLCNGYKRDYDDDSLCLCPVDIEEVAKIVGMKCESDDFDYYFV